MEKSKGFTLIELIIVMAILGILAGVIGNSFISSQRRARDAQRKSDLRNIASALELFNDDYNRYPPSNSGRISACPYQTNATTGVVSLTPCDWGVGEFQGTVQNSSGPDTVKTLYMKKLAADPGGGQSYYYKVDPTFQKFQLYAHLENTEDKNCINGNCNYTPSGITCGGGAKCNFSITSTNTTPTE